MTFRCRASASTVSQYRSSSARRTLRYTWLLHLLTLATLLRVGAPSSAGAFSSTAAQRSDIRALIANSTLDPGGRFNQLRAALSEDGECVDEDGDCSDVGEIQTSTNTCVSIRQTASLFDHEACATGATDCAVVKAATFSAERCCITEREGETASTSCDVESSLAVCESGNCDLTTRRLTPGAVFFAENDEVVVKSAQLGTVRFSPAEGRRRHTRNLFLDTEPDGTFFKQVSRRSRRVADSDVDFGDGFVADPATIDVEFSLFSHNVEDGNGDDDDDDGDDGGSDDDDVDDDGD